MSRPNPRTEAGGAHYHTLAATKKWSQFVAGESEHATRSEAERHRVDERRQDADKSVRQAHGS